MDAAKPGLSLRHLSSFTLARLLTKWRRAGAAAPFPTATWLPSGLISDKAHESFPVFDCFSLERRPVCACVCVCARVCVMSMEEIQSEAIQ